MKTLDRSSIREISVDMLKELEGVAAKHGVKFTYKGSSYNSKNCVFKIEAAIVGDDGVVCNQEREALKQYASLFNLSPTILDKTFISLGETFVVTGLSPRKSKFPVLATRIRDKKSFKFPADTIRKYFPTQTT